MNRNERLIAEGYDPEVVVPELFYRSSTLGSNFSPHSVKMLNPWTSSPTVYRTCEHRYQAMKATTLADHDYVNAANRPIDSKNRGREIQLREGWGEHYGDFCWYVMFEVVLAKTLQHAEVRRWLKSTGDRPIYEDSPTDDIWGWRYGNDHRGRNLLGRSWMQIRGVGKGLSV
jgi:ribA/ribD-fused uncharacterized protein